MRNFTMFALLLLAVSANAAPGLSDKIPKWQYAELSIRSFPARPAGVTEDGTEVPGTPAGMMIKWITAAGETDVKSWAELADALKASGLKKDGSPTLQKIQVLNFIGAEGWELVELQAASPGISGTARGPAGFGLSGSSTWLFKRRLP